MCERRKRIERRSCCRFHRFLQHLRQSISKKPSCRAGRRALVERYAFFQFGADPKTAELLFGTQCFGVLFALTFGNAAAVPLPPERKSERSYGEHGKRKSAPAARRGQSLQKTRRSGSAAKDRQPSSCCGCVSERLSRRLKGLSRANPADATRALCARLHTKPYGGRIFGLLCGGKIASSAGCRARERCFRILTAVLRRSARRPSRKQGSDGSGVSAAACSMRRMEAGGFILRAAASDAFDVPPHFQSGIMSGRACPALGFAVRRPMFICKALYTGRR